MGHGYLSVLGYGILIPFNEFKERFPELFVEHRYPPDQIYQSGDENAIRDFSSLSIMTIHRSAIALTIPSFSPPKTPRGCAEIEVIKADNLTKKTCVEMFAEKYFPQAKLQLYLYSYQDG